MKGQKIFENSLVQSPSTAQKISIHTNINISYFKISIVEF